MDHFERRARRQALFMRHIKQRSGKTHEERTQPLAAVQRAMRHGGQKALGGGERCNMGGQKRLGFDGAIGKLRIELIIGHGKIC